MRFTISSIETKNFRQYKGAQVIDFKFNKSKNVAIIKGRNGAGKSNLLNALTWCVYGIEPHIDQEKDQGMPIINTSALEESGANEHIEAEVIIRLETDIGPWMIKRTITGEKDSKGNVFIDKQSKLSVVYSTDGQDKIETGEGTQVLINNLLPEALRSFFFMDGEKLREFFKKDTAENIASAVEKVSQLDLMYKAAEHLESYEKEIRRSVKETTPQLTEINKKINQYEEDIKKVKEKISTNKDDLKKNKEELREIMDFLKNSGIEHVEKLSTEEDELRNELSSLKDRYHEAIAERNTYIVKIAPFIYLKEYLQDSLTLIETKIEKGELPSRIKETLVRELIEKGKCICGTLVEGKTKSNLEQYSRKLILSELSEITVLGKSKIKEILQEMGQFPQRMDIYYEKINSLQGEIDRKGRRVQQIRDELKKCEDKSEIILKERRRDSLYAEIAKLEQNNKLLLSDAEVYEKELKDKREDYEKELSSTTKNEELKRKLKLVQSTLQTLFTTEVKIKEKIREQIQKTTESNFFRLIRKQEAFRSISINDKYEVVVKHVSGYNVIDHLSAGEYMILGISFMSALMTISGFKAPVIIDTPLGKIDDEHRDKITKELPQFLEGTQLILLVTPTEYDQNVERNLGKFIEKGNYFEIKENKKNIESQVVQYG